MVLSMVVPLTDVQHTHTELAVLFVFRLLSSGSLRKLLAGWNDVCQLDERLERSQLEVLDLQHNHLTELPHNLFIKAQRWTHLFLPSFCSFLVCFFPSACIRYLSCTKFVPSVGNSSQPAIPKCVGQ